MRTRRPEKLDPRIRDALGELKGMILQRYPEATFEVSRGDDEPESIHLTTTVDVDDPDEVMDLVVDRLLELQVEEGLPVHVIPIRPVERVLAEMELRRRHPSLPKADLGDAADAGEAADVGEVVPPWQT
jgi:hypothetical protein